MAVGDMFLKLDGIEGESAVAGHENEIDIESLSWGLTNAGTGSYGGGSGAGRVDVADVSMMKLVDASSAKLQLACCAGTPISEAVITMRKAGGEDPLDYVVITLSDVMVSSFQISSTGPADSHQESFSLNFSKVKYEYQKQKEDGSGEPAGEYTWNCKKNKKE